MSPAWGDHTVFRMITGPHSLQTNVLGWELGNLGYRRYMNVFSSLGQNYTYGVILP